MKKNIAFFVKALRPCGPISVVFNLIKNLDKDKFNVMLISLEKGKDPETLMEEIHPYCSLGLFFLDDPDCNLEQLAEGLDVIHSHGFFPDKVLASLKTTKTKKISTIHCILYEDYIMEFGFIKGFIGFLLNVYYLNIGGFDRIVFCSDSVKQKMQKFFINSKKLHVVHNGVDSTIYHKIDDEHRRNLKQEMGLTDKVIYTYAGRIIKRKNVAGLIEKFKGFLDRNPSTHLLILGDGDELDDLKTHESHNLSFLGYKDNPEKFYQISDFVVSDSISEGYPMSILEAVSCGCYAYLSDIPSHREFILKYDREYADFISNLSLHKRERGEKELDMLSAKTMARLYEEIY